MVMAAHITANLQQVFLWIAVNMNRKDEGFNGV